MPGPLCHQRLHSSALSSFALQQLEKDGGCCSAGGGTGGCASGRCTPGTQTFHGGQIELVPFRVVQLTIETGAAGDQRQLEKAPHRH